MLRMSRSTSSSRSRPRGSRGDSVAGDVSDGGRPIEEVPGLDALALAFRSLRTEDEVSRFLRDLCTLPELEALAHRWQTVLLLEEGVPYVEIAERVPTSTATVTRVAQWLRHGTGGYRVALERNRPALGGKGRR
jgi:TrpR-related protein YerC/YecD